MNASQSLMKYIAYEGRPLVVALVGAGGKTTTMYQLAHLCKERNLRVLITTTTKIRPPSQGQVDRVHLTSQAFAPIAKGEILGVTHGLETDGKWSGVSPSVIDKWKKDYHFDVLICEADGAKEKSLKAPRQGEPLVPDLTDLVMGFMGLSVVGMAAGEAVIHRFSLFQQLTPIQENDAIELDHLAAVALHPNGLFRGVGRSSKKLVCLTKQGRPDGDQLAQAFMKALDIGEPMMVEVLGR